MCLSTLLKWLCFTVRDLNGDALLSITVFLIIIYQIKLLPPVVLMPFVHVCNYPNILQPNFLQGDGDNNEFFFFGSINCLSLQPLSLSPDNDSVINTDRDFVEKLFSKTRKNNFGDGGR